MEKNYVNKQLINDYSDSYLNAFDNKIADLKNECIDLNDTFIGIYFSVNGHAGVGLFKKDTVVKAKTYPFDVQYYQDLFSNEKVAMALDKNGNDRLFDFSHSLNSDMVNWKGNRGTISEVEAKFYDLPPVSSEIDRSFSLVQFTSVYPNMQGVVSYQDIILCLIDYCSKFELNEKAYNEIAISLKKIPQYLENKVDMIPTFVSISTNDIDLSYVSKNFNNIKRH